MKKLMVMMAAATTALGLFAAESVINHTASFSGIADVNPYVLPEDGLWSYTVAAGPAADEVKVASEKLVLATGSNVLSRNFKAKGAAADIGEGLYIDTVIDFQNQVLDTVPEMTGDAKIAIFALDMKEAGLSDTDGTNVFVMAGSGTDGNTVALYELSGFDSDFPKTAHRIAVKSYANVAASGSRSGFLVYISANAAPMGALVDGDLAQARFVYTKNGDAWVAAGAQSSTYLNGFSAKAELGKWVNQCSLFVSLVANEGTASTLSAVDFKGNATIESIRLTDQPLSFPADMLSMDVALTEATISVVEGATLNGNKLLAATAGTVTITVDTTKANVNVSYSGGDVMSLGGNQYSFTFVAGATLTVKAWDPAATVTIGDKLTDYPTIAEAVAAFKVTPNATLKLAQATVWPAADSDLTADNLTLDLAGKTLTLEAETVLSVIITGKLTITDSSEVGTGKIIGKGMVGNLGTLVIEKGIFEVAVANEGTANITGGSFAKATNSTEGETPAFTLAGSVAEGYKVADDGNYWTVQKSAEPTVEPGGETTVDAKSEADALAKVNLAATAPAGSGIDDATYAAYFTKKAATAGEAGKYIVTAVLNDEIVQAADVTAEVAAELNAVAADKATAATVTKAKPGLYYSVKYTDNVASMATAAEGDRVMAKGASVEVPMPKVVNANAMFYQVQVNVAPKAQ